MICIYRKPRVLIRPPKTTPCWKCWSNLWLLCIWWNAGCIVWRASVVDWPHTLPNYARSHSSLKTASTGTPGYSHSGISRKTCASAVGTHQLGRCFTHCLWELSLSGGPPCRCCWLWCVCTVVRKYIRKTYTWSHLSHQPSHGAAYPEWHQIEILIMCNMYMNMYMYT